MTEHKTWFITGAGRGMGVDFAQALLTISDEAQPPRRFVAGADAIAQAEQQVAEFEQQIDAYRALSSSLALDEAAVAASGS
jgi:NAD(P)-dependent dehydrogenase (short-subunit alcohol dehydrogenase family)